MGKKRSEESRSDENAPFSKRNLFHMFSSDFEMNVFLLYHVFLVGVFTDNYKINDDLIQNLFVYWIREYQSSKKKGLLMVLQSFISHCGSTYKLPLESLDNPDYR